jgi:hypothetical protein
MKRLTIPLLLALLALSCGGRKVTATVSVADTAKSGFCADSAFSYIKKQTDFGPRVPNTDAQQNCAAWLMTKLKQFGAETFMQGFETVTFDKTRIRGYNIIGSYNPESPTRIIICSHWDSRPWADNDPDPANWMKPVDAANDGASGVGVILEIARQLQKKAPQVGVDCIFFDAEDWGTPQWADVESEGETWALGAQYFATNLPAGYEARYGILLDMVGGVGAQFYREGISRQYAGQIVKKVWRAARQAGYGSYFPKRNNGNITDDHVPLNLNTHIPTIDIIPCYPDCEQSSFGPTWHTIKDDMEHIDKNTLKAVGQTIIQTLYTEE